MKILKAKLGHNNHPNNAIESRLIFPGLTQDSQSLLCAEPCRNRDCILGQIITDAMRFCIMEASSCLNLNAEVVKRKSMNSNALSGIIAALESGTIRNCLHTAQLNFNEVLPWPNELIILQVTGTLLRKMLQYGLSTKQSKNGGGFLQVSGLQYSFSRSYVDKNVDVDNRMNYTASSKNGTQHPLQPLIDRDKYWVVVTDWLAAGGDGYKPFVDQASQVIPTNISINEAVARYLSSSNKTLHYTLSPQSSRSVFIQTETQKSTWIAAISGFLGGAITFMLTFPIYSLFVKESCGSGSAQATRSELFDGVWLGTLATAISDGLYFAIYKGDILFFLTSWVRSLAAAVLNSLLSSPLWIMITWRQLALVPSECTWMQIAQSIYKTRGLCGFFDSLPYNLVLCIHPVVRQVFFEIFKTNDDAFGLRSCLGVGILGAAASIVATIVTYPIQKSRIIWQRSRLAAVTKLVSGFYAVICCDIIRAYNVFFAGVSFKLLENIVKNFLLFFFMEIIDGVMKSYV